MGAPTSYKDFYHYLEEKYPNSDTQNGIYLKIFKDKEDDYTNWSDLEVAIGKYTEQENIDEQKFLDDYDELVIDLSQYLKSLQEIYSSISLSYMTEIFKGTLNRYRAGLSDREADILRGALWEKYKTEDTVVNFITFNYTDIFDRLFERTSGFLEKNDSKAYFLLERPIHIHGTVNRFLTLGVNDEEQLSSYLSDEAKESLIKPKVLDALGTNIHNEVKTILSKTNLFIVYGMSLGVTDRSWWNTIAKECLNQDGYIILHQYDENVDFISPRKTIKARKEVTQSFLNRCHTLSQEEKELLREHIFVAFNETIFVSMELMKVFEEAKKDAL